MSVERPAAKAPIPPGLDTKDKPPAPPPQRTEYVNITGNKPSMTQRVECRKVRARDVGYPPMSREDKEQFREEWVKTGPVYGYNDDPDNKAYQNYKRVLVPAEPETSYLGILHYKEEPVPPEPRYYNSFGRIETTTPKRPLPRYLDDRYGCWVTPAEAEEKEKAREDSIDNLGTATGIFGFVLSVGVFILYII